MLHSGICFLFFYLTYSVTPGWFIVLLFVIIVVYLFTVRRAQQTAGVVFKKLNLFLIRCTMSVTHLGIVSENESNNAAARQQLVVVYTGTSLFFLGFTFVRDPQPVVSIRCIWPPVRRDVVIVRRAYVSPSSSWR